MRSLEGAKISNLAPSSEGIFKAVAPKFGMDV